MEGDEESVQTGEGTTSLTASSDDFCSREISELEKLSCLQMRKKMKKMLSVNHYFIQCERLCKRVHT